MVGIWTPGNEKLKPNVFRLICSSVWLTCPLTDGNRALNDCRRCPRAISLAESLTSSPRFVFNPRSIAPRNVSAMGVPVAAPLGTLPWNCICWPSSASAAATLKPPSLNNLRCLSAIIHFYLVSAAPAGTTPAGTKVEMISLDGSRLTFDEFRRVAQLDETVRIDPDALPAMLHSRAVVERLALGDDPVYAVNTGVGLLADVRVPPGELEQLQRNVVRSHACGVGAPLARDEVRGMMLIRANVLAKGFSGIRPIVAEHLCDLLNHGVTPVVPSQGSVGASGDLAPLAHIALVLIGEGEADFEGSVMSGAEALRRAAIEPLTLAAKEGISLINGTQAMLAIGCLEVEAAQTLAESADTICAMTLDALRG